MQMHAIKMSITKPSNFLKMSFINWNSSLILVIKSENKWWTFWQSNMRFIPVNQYKLYNWISIMIYFRPMCSHCETELVWQSAPYPLVKRPITKLEQVETESSTHPSIPCRLVLHPNSPPNWILPLSDALWVWVKLPRDYCKDYFITIHCSGRFTKIWKGQIVTNKCGNCRQ